MDGGRIEVLLIEDNPHDASQVRDMLDGGKSFPMRLECKERLSEGLSRLAEASFDVVILDLGLPDSSGIETVAKTHAHSPDVPIIVLTGREDEELGAHALWAGAQDYLLKGELTHPLLSHAIRYAISRQALETSLRRQSLVDAATGLYNREAFLSLVDRDLRLARRRNEKVALLAIHTGGLGRIAAAMGRQRGEQIFADFAKMLRASFRETDLLARIGPDDFAVLALDVSPEASKVLASRVRKGLLTLTKHPDWLSIQVGIVSPEAGAEVSPQDLLAKALQACED